MRAIYIQDIQIIEEESELTISPSQFSHLKKIARIREGEELLVLNGNGQKYFGTLLEFKKKTILFKLSKTLSEDKKYLISLALALPKKDAFEEVIEKSIQMGISTIHTFSSKFSQHTFKEANERLNNLMASSYQQSNNPYRLNIFETVPLESVEDVTKSYKHKFYFTSSDDSAQSSLDNLETNEDILFFIGPEGGLSIEEEKQLCSAGFSAIHLPFPIMKTPTAVCVAFGFISSKF